MILGLTGLYFLIGCFVSAAIFWGSEGEPGFDRVSMMALGLFLWPVLFGFVIYGIIEMHREG